MHINRSIHVTKNVWGIAVAWNQEPPRTVMMHPQSLAVSHCQSPWFFMLIHAFSQKIIQQHFRQKPRFQPKQQQKNATDIQNWVVRTKRPESRWFCLESWLAPCAGSTPSRCIRMSPRTRSCCSFRAAARLTCSAWAETAIAGVCSSKDFRYCSCV